MTHYIMGIEDKEPLRDSFQVTFSDALRSLQRQKRISPGEYGVETYDSPHSCLQAISTRLNPSTPSLSTVVADYLMANTRSVAGTDIRPSLYALHEHFTTNPSIFSHTPLIIVYSGKPKEEIIRDLSFTRFIDSSFSDPESTPLIGYRGKTGDLQGDVLDLFTIIDSANRAIKKPAGSVEKFRSNCHSALRAIKYDLKSFRFQS